MASDAAKLLGQLEDMLVAAPDLKAGKDGANAIIVAWLRDNISTLRTAAAGEAAWAECQVWRAIPIAAMPEPTEPGCLVWTTRLVTAVAATDAARKEAGCGG